VAVSSARPSMAAIAERARAARGREREAAGSEPARVTSLGDSTVGRGTTKEARAHGGKVGALLAHGGHVGSMCRPKGQFSEHVACSEMAKVDVNLGRLRAIFGDCLNMKFVAHMKLYIFY
jgi:hypothetical protein